MNTLLITWGETHNNDGLLSILKQHGPVATYHFKEQHPEFGRDYSAQVAELLEKAQQADLGIMVSYNGMPYRDDSLPDISLVSGTDAARLSPLQNCSVKVYHLVDKTLEALTHQGPTPMVWIRFNRHEEKHLEQGRALLQEVLGLYLKDMA